MLYKLNNNKSVTSLSHGKIILPKTQTYCLQSLSVINKIVDDGNDDIG